MDGQEKQKLANLFLELLSIPSPTFFEQEKLEFVQRSTSGLGFERIASGKSGLVISKLFNKPQLPESQNNPANRATGLTKRARQTPLHIAFFGHLDVVPKHFSPKLVRGKFFGAGASDMQSGIAAYMHLIVSGIETHVHADCRISFIFYNSEETSDIEKNGLFDLLKEHKSFFQTIDFAIVGEPTDRQLQFGSVGSMHARVTFLGEACHSARPWQGENAIYKAASFIKNIEKVKPKKHSIVGFDFYDTVEITESHSEKGKTIIPSFWECNVNFRFNPALSEMKAKKKLKEILIKAGARERDIKIYSSVYAGRIVESTFFHQAIKALESTRKNIETKAKQAWTDVAQLGKFGIPAVNYGPGLTSQCHKPSEYSLFSDLIAYVEHLRKWLRSLPFDGKMTR